MRTSLAGEHNARKLFCLNKLMHQSHHVAIDNSEFPEKKKGLAEINPQDPILNKNTSSLAGSLSC
jgi:hypothetical protein